MPADGGPQTSPGPQASHCFGFENDFLGNWRCIPLCLRRKLDLAGVKLRLNHWLQLSEAEREELVQWPDDAASLKAMAQHLMARTGTMAEGAASTLPIPSHEPWQQSGEAPERVVESAALLGVLVTPSRWAGLSELERFALCKLARPGHDHHNLAPALEELFGAGLSLP